MRMTIVGSNLCPNTLYSIVKCKEAGITFSFADISASLADLKKFLALHEHDAVYADLHAASGKPDYAEHGKIGLPCFVFEDGTKTLDLNKALAKAKQ